MNNIAEIGSYIALFLRGGVGSCHCCCGACAAV